jgi:hypothetical protein
MSAEFGAPSAPSSGGAKGMTLTMCPKTAGLALIFCSNFGGPASIR